MSTLLPIAPPPPPPSINTSWEPIIILYVCLACVQVIIPVLPGVWYARIGLATPAVRRALATVNFNVVFPAVFFTSTASIGSASTIATYWPFAVNAVLSNTQGMIISYFLYPLSRGPKNFKYSFIALCGFNSLVAVPLLVISALCSQEKLVFYQALGSKCSVIGFSYAAISAVAVNVFTRMCHLPYTAVPIALFLLKNDPKSTDPISSIPSTATGDDDLRGADAAEGVSHGILKDPAVYCDTEKGGSTILQQQQLSSSSSSTSTIANTTTGIKVAGRSLSEAAIRSSTQPEYHRRWLVTSEGKSFLIPNNNVPLGEEDNLPGFADIVEESNSIFAKDPYRAPLYSRTTFWKRELVQRPKSEVINWLKGSGKDFVVAEDIVDIMEGDTDGTSAATKLWKGKPMVRLGTILKNIWHVMITYVIKPPLVSSLLGLLVGAIDPLRKLFYPIPSAPLGFVSGAIFTIQTSLLFLMSFVLGAAMAKGPGSWIKKSGVGTLIMTMLIRFVISPIIGCVIVIGSSKLGIWTPQNPVYYMVLMLSYCMPTANQIQNIASMFGHHEEYIGTLIFFQLLVMIVTTPFWVTVFLLLGNTFDMFGYVYT